MRLPAITVGLLTLLTPLVSAWSKDDHEIFRVRDELITHEGPDVTFYQFLGVKTSATLEEINRAYKKKSRALHPDKVKAQLQGERAKQKKSKSKKKPGVTVTKPPTQAEIKAAVKKASERQARLSIVANILRGPGRDRYDYFLNNGFPTWKGTGYYYSRYRPGLGTVLFGCFIVGCGGFHYLALWMSWKRQREFVERYIKFARNAAWGDSLGIPGLDGTGAPAPAPAPPAQLIDEDQAPMPANRKQRRMQEREARRESAKEGKRPGRGRGSKAASGSATPVPQAQSSGPTGAKKRVVAENGKILVVDSLGDVYLEQEDADGNIEEFLLDPTELHKPTIRDTGLVKLPAWFYSITVGRLFAKTETAKKGTAKRPTDKANVVVEDVAGDDDTSDAPQRTPSSSDSADDFEMLDTTKSIEDLAKKVTGSQTQHGGKTKKRNKKR